MTTLNWIAGHGYAEAPNETPMRLLLEELPLAEPTSQAEAWRQIREVQAETDEAYRDGDNYRRGAFLLFGVALVFALLIVLEAAGRLR